MMDKCYIIFSYTKYLGFIALDMLPSCNHLTPVLFLRDAVINGLISSLLKGMLLGCHLRHAS